MASSPASPLAPPQHLPNFGAQKPSWSSLAESRIDHTPTYSTDFEVIDGVVQATIQTEILRQSQPLWTNYMVGFFIGDAPHIGKIHATVNRLWKFHDKPMKIDAQFLNPKTVLFRIKNPHIQSRVLQRHFWHIGDIPLIVQEWSPKSSHLRSDLTSMPIWVDLKNVLDYLYSEKGLLFLGDIIGASQKLHLSTERCIRLDVARVLVVVNLEKPLLK